MICGLSRKVFINFNARLSIIAGDVSNTSDRRFTAKDRGYDKADDGLRELSIDITPPWQMTQRNAAIAALAKEKGEKGRRIARRISRTARFLPRASRRSA